MSIKEEQQEIEMKEYSKGKVSSCCKSAPILIEYGEYVCESCDRVCTPISHPTEEQ